MPIVPNGTKMLQYVLNVAKTLKAFTAIDSGMMQDGQKPWFWGIDNQKHPFVDGPYTATMERFRKAYIEKNNKPPSDALMDLYGCSLAFSIKKENLKL